MSNAGVVVVALATLTSAQLCLELANVVCDAGVCNTDANVTNCTTSQLVFQNDTSNGGCPCQCNEQCADPADAGIYCSVRDCWDGVCMNMSIGDLVCDTFNPCTARECIDNATASSYECGAETVVDASCCQTADDCETQLGYGGACTRYECHNFSTTTGRGTCALVAESDRCCDRSTNSTAADAYCTATFGTLCARSVCVETLDAAMGNTSTGRCSTPVETVCAASDPSDLCSVGRCNATTGECENVTLGVDECPGVCCLAPNDDACVDVNDPTNADPAMDEAWCIEAGGIRFVAGAPECTPGICDTAEPTAEPTREPSPSPTQQCSIDADCPNDPANKCRLASCNTGAAAANTCEFVAVDCDDQRNAAWSPCITGVCQFDSGLCDFARNYSCCTPDDFAHCHESGGDCSEAYCDMSASLDNTTGVCAINTTETLDGCCESDEFCRQGDLCSLAYCDHVTHTCRALGVERVCDEPFDVCTDRVCDRSDGVCKPVRAAHQPKCPGACCVAVDATCRDDLDYFECKALTGNAAAWLGSNVTCATAGDASHTCGYTVEPTAEPSVEPTPPPTLAPPNVSCCSATAYECTLVASANECVDGFVSPSSTCALNQCGGVCCQTSGQCTLGEPPFVCAGTFLGIGLTCDACPPAPTTIPAELAVYARTLCRELYACGDADESLCAAPDTALDECVERGCCAYSDIPER